MDRDLSQVLQADGLSDTVAQLQEDLKCLPFPHLGPRGIANVKLSLRKRRQCRRDVDRIAQPAPQHEAGLQHLQGLGVITLAPVSYTHLRAHETDSYLVCRLLL